MTINSGINPITQIGFGALGQRRYNFPEEYIPREISESRFPFPEIRFLNLDGSILGKIRTDVQKTILISLDFKDDENGSNNFSISFNSPPPFEIIPFSIMQVKIGFTNFYWYGGEIQTVPEEGTQKDVYKYGGFGLNRYLRALKSDGDYSAGTDIGEVVDDIVQNKIVPETPIKYRQRKINRNTGVILANKIELGKYDLWKVMDTLSQMANHIWGVDGDLEFYFEAKDNDTIQKSFFIGYNLNKFDPQQNYKDIKNAILVQRQEGKGSGGAGWAIAGNYSSPSSIKKYGRKELNFQIPGFFEQEEADIIGNALKEELSEPRGSGKMQGYQIQSELDYLTRGAYRFIMPFKRYQEVYNDLDDPNDFTKIGSGDLTISKDEDVFIWADGSIKLNYTTAKDDYILLNQNIEGNLKSIQFYCQGDRVGNYATVGIGKTSWDENTNFLDIPLRAKWFKYIWDISALDITEINYFGIRIDENAAFENNIYIDKLIIELEGNKFYKLQLKRADYKFNGKNQEVSAEFGVIDPRMENYVASLFSTASELRFTGEIR